MGEYSLKLLRVGHSQVPGPEARWMRDFDTWTDLVFQVALIRGQGRTILVNTGPPDDISTLNEGWTSFLGDRAALHRSDDDHLLERLAREGIAPADVTDIILTPLQLYTVGNLRAFPNARIHISKTGWVHFHTSHDHLHDDRWTSIPRETLIWLVTDAWSRVSLLGDEDEVLPGIRTWWCGGHHRASIVVEVTTRLGVAAISDSYFHLSNVIDEHPIGITENIYESVDAYRRVKRTADVIVPLYDPLNFTRFPDGSVA